MAEKKSPSSPRKKTAPTKTPQTISLSDLKNEIDARAHQIYLDRMAAHTPGDELSDWLQAEAEIKKAHKLA